MPPKPRREEGAPGHFPAKPGQPKDSWRFLFPRHARPSGSLIPGSQVRPPARGLLATSPQGGQQGSPVLIQNLEERDLRPHGRKGHENRQQCKAPRAGTPLVPTGLFPALAARTYRPGSAPFPPFLAEDPLAHAHTSPLAAGCTGACAKPRPLSRVRRRSGLHQAVPPEGQRAGLLLKRRLESNRNQLGQFGMLDL